VGGWVVGGFLEATRKTPPKTARRWVKFCAGIPVAAVS